MGPTFLYGDSDTPPQLVAFYDTLGIRRTHYRLNPRALTGVLLEVTKFWVRIRRHLKKKSDEPDETGCLNWQGAVDNNGYGRKTVSWPYEGLSEVHRLACILAHDLLRKTCQSERVGSGFGREPHLSQQIVHDLTHLVLGPREINNNRNRCRQRNRSFK